MKQDIVYKYTSIETFKKIIDGKTLRLTDIQKSNDASELKLIYGVVKKVFIEEFEKDKPNYIKSYFPTENFNSFYEENTKHIDATENIIHTQYTTCFSTDGDMLSQWRGYGEDGKGISIGFDVDIFKEDEHYKFGKVEYSNRKQKALFRNDVKDCVRSIRQYVKEHNSIDGYPVQDFMRRYNALLLRSVFVKNYFFHEEREWRYSFWYSKTQEYEKMKIQENAIKQVIMGPKCGLNKEEIEELLRLAGFTGSEVIYSKGHGIYVESENHRVNQNISEL